MNNQILEKGYATIPGFLDSTEIEGLLREFEPLALRPPVPNKLITAPLSALLPLTPKVEKLLDEISATGEFSPDRLIGAVFFSISHGIDLSWHQDHESYYIQQTHNHYLNLYIPIIKPEPDKSNLSLVPADTFQEHAPKLWRKLEGGGASHADFINGRTVITNDQNGGVWGYYDGQLEDIAVTPCLHAGDALLMRGDLMHRTQDTLTSRVAISIRACNNYSTVTRNHFLTTCPAKIQYMRDNPVRYRAATEVFKKHERMNLGDFLTQLDKEMNQAGETRADRIVNDDLVSEFIAERRLVDADREDDLTAIPGFTRFDQPVAFVLCAPRSGSTLLRIMLAGHPLLFAPPELRMMDFDTLSARRTYHEELDLGGFQEGAYTALVAAAGIQPEEARRQMAAMEEQGLSVASFYSAIMACLGERTLIDKTPDYAGSPVTLRRIQNQFPNARYIHLVRHPAPTICSYSEMLDTLIWESPSFGETLKKSGRSIRELGECQWVAHNRNICEFLDSVAPERQVRIFFEDLVTQPEAPMRRICNCLGVEFDSRVLEPYDHHPDRMTEFRPNELPPLGDRKFHTKSSIDSSAAQSWKAEALVPPLGDPASRLAQQFNYT